jgi:hypothetical protein
MIVSAVRERSAAAGREAVGEVARTARYVRAPAGRLRASAGRFPI